MHTCYYTIFMSIFKASSFIHAARYRYPCCILYLFFAIYMSTSYHIGKISNAILVHLSRRLKCTIVILRCPSSVRPSLTFHIFDFSSETAEQNSTKLYRKQDLNLLYQVCVFRADRKNKMAALASDWVRLFRLLL